MSALAGYFDQLLRAGRDREERAFRDSIRHLTPQRQRELLEERKAKRVEKRA